MGINKTFIMAQYKTIKRYALLLEIIEKYHPTFDEIMKYLERNDFKVTDRTIQRDIQYIRTHYGIDIKYRHLPAGYYIDKKNSPDLPNLLRFIEIANTAAIVVESLQEGRKSISYMDFESDGSLRGYDLLEPLLNAIKKRRMIRFFYELFDSSAHKSYLVQPLLLKEYQTRWYLVGIRDDVQELRIFGIDRINRLELLSKTFEPKRGYNPLDVFRHTIGINISENKPEFVQLSFTRLQGKYVRTLPWHHSQKILDNNHDELRIELYVNPNLEFKQRIMASGAAVKVLKPKWLADEIRDRLQASFERYK